MRVVIATFHRNLVGGTEKYLQTILRPLVQRGHEIALVHEYPFDPTKESIDSTDLPVTAWCLREFGLAAVRRALSQWKPDVVYNQGLQASDLESFLVDSYPTVLFAHGYYGTCGSGSKCHSFPRVQPCQRRFGPACLVLHYPRHCGALDPREAWNTYRLQAERHARLPRYRSILVASTHMRDEFLRQGASPAQVLLARLPGEDVSQASIPSVARRSPDRILMIGRLTRVKGGHYLIPAVSRASKSLGRPLKLIIAGDGPERSNLESLAGRYQSQVEFPGWVDTERKIELLQSSDLVAVPSLWPEPFGLVGIEAGAMGIPAVAYRVGGIADWLIGGETGELAPGDPPTIEGLAEAIVRALHDDSHYATLVRGSRRSAQEFSLDAHLDKLERALGMTTAASVAPLSL